jgi:excisionase family DNA binding protein
MKTAQAERGSDFLTVKETSQYLRLKPLSIYRMVKDRKIPFKRAGRSIRFVKQEIDVWLKWGSGGEV